MGGQHPVPAHQLVISTETPVHRLSPEVKLVALVMFVTAAAVTPRAAVWAFAIYGLLLAVVAAVARIPPGVIARRALVVAPFLAVAAAVPFIGDGQRTSVGPLQLSIDGLWAAWNIAAKAVIGATASILLTATTPIPELLAGMTRLHVPRAVVAIVSFMVRYLDLIVDQWHRMRRAMIARSHDPRWLWHARPIAASAGTLFVRTYERGERVHQAMRARGFTGHMPDLNCSSPRLREWVALAPAVVAVTSAVAALILR